ncbi:MAG: hypothetical protein JJU10_00285 [Idiomarina sp.]|nr:hypothetical protein [Idiomarina sp.]
MNPLLNKGVAFICIVLLVGCSLAAYTLAFVGLFGPFGAAFPWGLYTVFLIVPLGFAAYSYSGYQVLFANPELSREAAIERAATRAFLAFFLLSIVSTLIFGAFTTESIISPRLLAIAALAAIVFAGASFAQDEERRQNEAQQRSS